MPIGRDEILSEKWQSAATNNEGALTAAGKRVPAFEKGTERSGRPPQPLTPAPPAKSIAPMLSPALDTRLCSVNCITALSSYLTPHNSCRRRHLIPRIAPLLHASFVRVLLTVTIIFYLAVSRVYVGVAPARRSEPKPHPRRPRRRRNQAQTNHCAGALRRGTGFEHHRPGRASRVRQTRSC